MPLLNEMSTSEAAYEVGFKSQSAYIAAFKMVLIALPIDGFVSSLIAIVAIIGSLTDKATLGPYLAVAILTLLYSLVLELLLLPVAAKLWSVKKQNK